MAANKPFEFVEHYNLADGTFVTDIWYNPQTCQYHSVVSDLEPITFGSVEELRLYLDGTLGVKENGHKTKAQKED